ncbi:MAG TPA: RodZ domain-containing protein, partial [Anaerolineales bacterium]|nr:RodZ domain-containing protein [Anaerolineales bacterium]
MTTTIGQKLKAAREDQRLTFEKVFESTRIRVQYLQALEADDLSVMPSPVQARGYLRNYAEYLGLDVDTVLEELREANAQKPSEVVIGPADVQEAQTAPLADAVPAPVIEIPVEEPPALTKPKPARRKKAVTPADGDPVTPPSRRGRKKTSSEVEIPAPMESETSAAEVELEKEDAPALEFEPDAIDVPPAQMDTDGAETKTGTPVAPIAEDIPVHPPSGPTTEIQPEPDASDTLWQKWLNRLSPTLAARNKRKTLIPSETVLSELEAGVESPPFGSVTVQDQAPELQNVENSTEIFKEIGRDLRERRELLSLHLEEVERNTHVKAHYLDALERGAVDDLPSTVQTRGMLSNYATFLDLDVDTILLRFADALQARHRERNPQKPARKPGQPILATLPPMRSFIAGDLIFGVGIVILLVGFAIWGVSRVLTLQVEQDVNPTAPSISEILLASPDPSSFTATPSPEVISAFPGEATVTVVIPTLNANVNVQVNLVAVERTYMRVIVDGEVVFEGRVVPGTAYPFEAVDQVEVLVGSGAAIRIVYNG